MAESIFRLGIDENLDQRIVDGLRLRDNTLDIVTIWETELAGADDLQVLDWAARERRVLFTHDRKTIPNFAYERIAQGLRTTGVFIVPKSMPIGVAIEEILLIVETTTVDEWNDTVTHLPL